MRLIDGDDLYRKVVGYNGGAVDKTVAKRLIEQQPTVQRNSTQSNASNTLNALDTIYRQAAIDVVKGIDSGFVKYIEELPSAQPEVIRCRDCKHNPKYEWFGCPMSHLSEAQRPETAWCWKAERRTDGVDS